MKVLNDILGYDNLKIYQDLDYFCFSLDSVILANFCTIRLRDKKICDMGTGNGVIPFILSKRTDKPIIGVEIQDALYDLANESLKYNKLENQITFIHDDIDNLTYHEEFDLVTCNPPYFPVHDKNYFNEQEEKVIARHEVKMNLDKMCSVASRILKNNGNFAMVHRTERIMEIVAVMRKYHIEPKRIVFIHEKINKESTLVFIEGQKCGSVGLKIDAPFIMYNEDGSMTLEYNKLTKEVRK